MSILTSFPEFVRPRSSGELSWHEEVRTAVRNARDLCQHLGLSDEWTAAAQQGTGDFPVFVPPSFLARICPGDPGDPLLRQVLPTRDEAIQMEGYLADPVDDSSAMLAPGVLQKYAGRALLIATGSCAVHCRYCFRRYYPYQESPHSNAAWEQGLESLAKDPSITEVILSGGDPFMLVDEQLGVLVDRIADLSSVKRLRVHTRFPIMIPSRVTDSLLDVLTKTRLTPIVVIHANHAQELDDDVGQSMERLQKAKVLLLNQAVLLRGVNDTVDSQIALSERLVEIGVMPYYLHQLDRVRGAAHFEVPISQGKKLITQMRAKLPGYLVPKYVQEIPNEPHKRVLS